MTLAASLAEAAYRQALSEFGRARRLRSEAEARARQHWSLQTIEAARSAQEAHWRAAGRVQAARERWARQAPLARRLAMFEDRIY